MSADETIHDLGVCSNCGHALEAHTIAPQQLLALEAGELTPHDVTRELCLQTGCDCILNEPSDVLPLQGPAAAAQHVTVSAPVAEAKAEPTK